MSSGRWWMRSNAELTTHDGQLSTVVRTVRGRPVLLITICRASARVVDSAQTVSVPAWNAPDV